MKLSDIGLRTQLMVGSGLMVLLMFWLGTVAWQGPVSIIQKAEEVFTEKHLAKPSDLSDIGRPGRIDQLTEDMQHLALSFRRTMILLIFGLAITGIGMAFCLTRFFFGPLGRIQAFTERLAAGDFVHLLQIDRADEIGQIGQALNRHITSLTGLFREITNGVSTLGCSFTGLGDVAGKMNQAIETTSDKAQSMATAAGEMSEKMAGVAAATGQASANVNMVAAAVEEMSATVREIARNSEKARDITHAAVSRVQDASTKVDLLGGSAREIDKVTEVINEISEQTNLLALNATIEAARAGEAGKGFAVVANEIKELAKQTAAATGQIRQKVESIQGATAETVEDIKAISKVISDIDEIVATIDTAVEEQTTAASEIAANITQASQGISEVNANVAMSSTAAGQIAKEIADLDRAAEEMSAASSQVRVSVDDLSKLAGHCSHVISGFKINAAHFDIGSVKAAHLKWRSRLEAVLRGQQSLRPEEVSDHHQCDFGKWYDGAQGQSLKRHAAFQTVGRHHQNVHDFARRIVETVQNGDTSKAQSLMAGFEGERQKLFERLDELYRA